MARSNAITVTGTIVEEEVRFTLVDLSRANVNVPATCNTRTVAFELRSYVTTCPLRTGTLSPERGDDHLTPERQISRLREVLEGFGGLIGQIRDTLGPSSQIVYRPLETLLLAKPWHKGHIVLIGDAVHAATPQLASGAGAAGDIAQRRHAVAEEDHQDR